MPNLKNEIEDAEIVDEGAGLVLWMFGIFAAAGCFSFGYASGVFGWL